MNEEKIEVLNQIPEKPDYSEEILAIINGKYTITETREKLSLYHDNDIAEVIPELTLEARKKLYRILGVDWISDIFAYLEDAHEYLLELGNEKAADVIESMDADDAVEILDDLSEESKNQLLPLLEPEAQEDIKLIDSYDDDMIGSRMTTNFISIKNTYSVKQAMRSVISQAAENDNITTIYVVNESEEFYGAIELRDLVIARDQTPLSSIITTNYPYLYANENTDDCIEKIKDYEEDSFPVLDNDNKLIGIITAADVVVAVDEQLGEDYVKFAGLTEEEDLNEPLLKSVKKRIPWLFILLFLGMFVATIIQSFQAFIPPSLIIIYTFQSLILGMSGNSGTQSLAVTIRLINDDELGFKEKIKFVFKELRVATLNGLIIGVIAFVFIGLYIQFIETSFTQTFGVSGFAISLCIGISLLLAMIIAGLDGTLIPIIFKKIGIDPAVASGPLITTINDLVAVFVYYGTSILLLVNFLGIA
ncbi:MAG: magnesium transporter [Clostridia bacterium]|nr:magnesium transporter [Clostridia bacterium]